MLKRLALVMILTLLFILPNVISGSVQAQAAELPPLTEPGPYGVRMIKLTFVDKSRDDWKLEIRIWYPADKTKGTPITSGSLMLKDAPPDKSGAPYPLIIYSHGLMQTVYELMGVKEQLASLGYVVVAPQHHDAIPIRFELVDRPLDILLLMDNLATLTEGDLAGMIDTDNVGLMGYSTGGQAVLQMLGVAPNPARLTTFCAQHSELKTFDCNLPADLGQWPFAEIANYRTKLGLKVTSDGQWGGFSDKRIHAVLAMAPCFFPLTTEDMLASVTTPTMILHGTMDEICDYQGNAGRTYTHLGTEGRYLISIVGGRHAVMLEPELSGHFASAFFGYYLKGDKSYQPYLTPEHLPAWTYPKLAWGPYEGK